MICHYLPKKKKILLLQRKAINTNSTFYAYTESLFKELQILKKLMICILLRVLKLCFNIFNSQFPIYFFKYINSINNLCNYHIRTPVYRHLIPNIIYHFNVFVFFRLPLKVSVITKFHTHFSPLIITPKIIYYIIYYKL